MDELEISGKRYISSRRAGKEHRYHPDYIGQLIRGGKVPGQKVGRAWYVDAEALKAYFSGELLISIEQTKHVVPVVTSTEVPASEVVAVEPKQQRDEHSVSNDTSFTPTQHGNAIELFTEERTHEVQRSMGPVHISVKDTEGEQSKIQSNTRGLQYMADDSDLFPLVSKPQIVATPSEVSMRPQRLVPQKTRTRVSWRLLTVVGVSVFVIALALCGGLVSVLSAGQNQVASAGIMVSN